jgi:hypothetical protein
MGLMLMVVHVLESFVCWGEMHGSINAALSSAIERKYAFTILNRRLISK